MSDGIYAEHPDELKSDSEADDEAGSYTLVIGLTPLQFAAWVQRLEALEAQVAALQKRLDEAEGGK